MVSPSSSSQSSNKESIFLNSFYNNDKYGIIPVNLDALAKRSRVITAKIRPKSKLWKNYSM